MRARRLAGAAFAAALLLPGTAAGQQILAVGGHYQGYELGGAAASNAADLWIFPVAYRLQLTQNLNADVYAAWARGTVETTAATYTLEGFVDTRVRANYQFAPWGILSVGVNVPTGNSGHDQGEAVVAAVMSGDLFGFRESTWGTGLHVTTGVATAHRMGDWGVGLGASYRVSDDFEPRSDEDVVYEPGNEIRFKLGLDRNVGETGKFTAGLTFFNYSEDQSNNLNFFQSGNRYRADLTYQFRFGEGTWTMFATDVWREEGDVFLYDATLAPTGTFTVGSQNLLIVGLAGAEVIAGGIRLRPMLDVRMLDREDDVGSGVLVGFGGDVPLRLFGGELLPRFRIISGTVEGTGNVDKGVLGTELGMTFRWRF